MLTRMVRLVCLDLACRVRKDTKTFPKCYVGRNGKQKQQNYTYKCVDRSRHNGIKDAKAKCAH